MLAKFRRLLPLLVAAGALLIAVRGTNLSQVRDALGQAPLGLLLLTSAVMTLLNCAADTLAMFYVFRWFGMQLRFGDLYTIRAATYTLAVINYHAGQLGIIGYLHRVGKVSLSRASAYILFIVGVWVALLMTLAGGSLLLGGEKARALGPVLLLFFLGLGFYAVLLRFPPRFLLEPPPQLPSAGLLMRLWLKLRKVAYKLWAPLHEAGIFGHLRALVVRLPHLLVLLLWHFIALRCFRIEVPFHVAALYLPVVFAVTSLPISVQGLGTSQVAAKYFFSEFSPGGDASVLAYSLSMTAISTASNLIMGVLFLGRGARLGLSDMTASAARGLEDSSADGGSDNGSGDNNPPVSGGPGGLISSASEPASSSLTSAHSGTPEESYPSSEPQPLLAAP